MESQFSLSIDIGYSSVKVCFRDGTNQLITSAFPTLSPTADHVDLSPDQHNSPNVHRICIDGTTRLFGPGVLRFCEADEQPVQDAEFARHASHEGYVLSAIHTSGRTTVDHLVLGLPMARFALDREALIQRYAGRHMIEGYPDIHIRQVHVLPQVVGGLLGAASNQPDEIRTSNSVVLDIGHGTSDWVFAEGVKPNAKRAGSHQVGMRRIQQAIASAIETDRLMECPITSRFTEDLKQGYVRLRGETLDIEPYRPAAQPLIDQVVNRMRGSILADADVDQIIVVGGGANYFLPTIKRVFAGLPVLTSPHGVYTNVRGFQIAGEMLAQSAETSA